MTGAEIVEAGAPCQRGPSRHKYTPETLDTLLSCIADGLTISQACKASSISRTCFNNWRDKFPEFAEALEQARETARRKALAVIKAAADKGDYNAAVQFLRFSYHPEYCKPEARVNVTAQAGIQLVCTPEQRERLLQLQAQLQSGDNKMNMTGVASDFIA